MILFSQSVFASKTEELMIEHQIRLCDDAESITKKLDIEKSSSNDSKNKKYETYYVETKERNYQNLEWSIRIRLKQDKTEITLKKKSIANLRLDSKYPNMKCEYDLHANVKDFSCKLTSEISADDFQQVLKNNKNWLDLLDANQYSFLKDNNALFKDAVVYGTMINRRLQWENDSLGAVTLDIIHQDKKASNTFHEISIRYPITAPADIGVNFENYIKSVKIKTCTSQVERPVNKFDLLEILN